MQEFAAWCRKMVQAVGTLRTAAQRGLSVEEAVAEGLGAEYASMGERPRYTSEEHWIRMLCQP